MPLNPPLCLEVVFTNVQATSNPNLYTATFIATGQQAYGTGDSFYNVHNLATGMWCGNNSYGYSFLITQISNVSDQTADVVIEDVDGFNASIDPSGIGGGPGDNVVGYVYELNANGLPVLQGTVNSPNIIWAEGQTSRFTYLQPGFGPGGIITTDTGATGPTGDTGPQGVPGTASDTGATGAPGIGIPPGGDTGQVLTKVDSVDYNTTWTDPGNRIYNDKWIQQNFIDPPPAIVFETVSSTSTDIYVPWKYPLQKPIGLLSSWIPVVNTLSMQISIDSNASNPGVNPYTVSTLVNVSTNYVNLHNNTPFVTGMILSKVAGVNQIESRTFPDTTQRNAYVYHDPTIGSIINSQNSLAIGWYANTNPSTNVASTILGIFTAAGPPSFVRSLFLALQITTGTFSYTAPQQIDSTDPSTSLYISNYTITYSSLASTVRYGTPLADPTHTVQNGTSLSYSASSLFPDASYTFTVKATNSGNGIGQAVSVIRTTQNLSPIPALSGLLSFPARYYSNGTIVNILSGIPKANLINTISPWSTSSSFKTPIHSVALRGSGQNSTIMTVSVSLTNNTTVITGPSITFSGFPTANNPQVTTQNYITLTPYVKDSYSTPGGAQTGFYLESDNNIGLDTLSFVPSQYDYVLTASQSGSFSGSANFTYQYDTLISSAPTINSITVTMNGAPYKAVSGVNVIYGSPTFTVTSTLTNMGHYYYSSPLLVYSSAVTGWSPTSEITTANVISGLTNGTFANTIVIRNTSVTLNSLENTYTNSMTLSATANNQYTSSALKAANSIPAIVDGPSVQLVYSTLAQTIPFLSNGVTDVIGYHIPSGVAGPAGVPPFTNGGSPYANTPYDNTLNISNTQDLQISNGRFTTPTGEGYSYIDYTGYRYTDSQLNPVNYTSIQSTGYRYASFAWAITPSPTSVYGSLNIKIVNSSGLTITNNLAYIGSGTSNQIQLFYRVEDTSSPSPTNLGNMSTAWINGNSTSGISSTGGNYYIPTDYTLPPYYGLNSVSGSTTTTFNLKIPALVIQSGKTVNLYCRIGLPMAANFSFSYITATMGS